MVATNNFTNFFNFAKCDKNALPNLEKVFTGFRIEFSTTVKEIEVKTVVGDSRLDPYDLIVYEINFSKDAVEKSSDDTLVACLKAGFESLSGDVESIKESLGSIVLDVRAGSQASQFLKRHA